ncbi:uncharacterized protein LOC131025569 [Salvia miltiorrhiza]|uniref:uncharacterized protein LOC131025569 n=1 Tax=Salvia miltiorrhiza TaxID=226208 RepID=UPI0025AC9AB3|nr:uncharacterized protein LOC131025569 [Salvia miltiorrhiza]
MGEWVEGVWSWKLEWERELRGREQSLLTNLLALLHNAAICAGKSSGWRWKPHPHGKFSVKTAYEVLSLSIGFNSGEKSDPEIGNIWKIKAPFKAKMMSWKIFKSRIPTTDNLIRRQIPIPPSEAVCVLCKSQEDNSDHLFFACKKTYEVWLSILSWLGKQAALHCKPRDHFNAFKNIGQKGDVTILESIWTCVVWCIWKARNECKFNNGSWCKDKIVTEIIARVWGWKNAYKIRCTPSDFRSWSLGEQILS